MRFYALVLLLLLSLVAPASARDQASLKDLTINADRVPLWNTQDGIPIDTTGWTQTPVACASSPVGDFQDILDAQAAAANETVLILPADCTYLFPDGGPIEWSKHQIVVRGTSNETTILRFQKIDGGEGFGFTLGEIDFPKPSPWGGSRTWTGGFDVGDQVLTLADTVGLTVGGWVRVSADPQPDWNAGSQYSYTTKLECVGTVGGAQCSALAANQVKIETELRTPFETPNPVLEYETQTGIVEHVGFENLRFEHTQPGLVDKYSPYFQIYYCMECWVTDSVFTEAGNQHIQTQGSRGVFRGNNFGRVNCWSEGDADVCLWNKGVIYFKHHSSDNVMENNVIDDSPSGPTDEGGNGNVIAWNYMTGPKEPSPAVPCERHAFLHGRGTCAVLIEGNDTECGMQWDTFRNGQGYNHLFYRNRLRGTDNGGFVQGRLGGEYLGSYINRGMMVIGNHVNELQGSPQASVAWNLETDSTHANRDIWGSYNIARSNMIHDTTAPVPTNGVEFENYTRADPHPSWDGLVFPASMYRGDTPPDWWCVESGPWGDSIGAPSDDANGTYWPIPAELRDKGLPCTPLDAVAPPAPIVVGVRTVGSRRGF